MSSVAGLQLQASRAVLLVVDLQDKLAAAMPPAELAAVLRNTAILIEAARRFAIPLILSEQYPRGLGHTVAAIAEAAASHPSVHRLEKVEFGACQAPGFAEIDAALAGRDQWIVTGMESHVCVYQTARALAEKGRAVHVPRDAVLSRTAENRQTGLELMARAGAVPTSTETVVFDLLGAAGSDDFKALSRLIR